MPGEGGGGSSSSGDIELRRLAALEQLGILDTPPDPHLDTIAAVCARLLGASTALITLVDRDRQWFKARIGWEVDQTARDISFCATTIGSDGVMVVEDAANDPRFAANPLVTGSPHVRFYAGAPLRTRDGHRIGALAVLDTRPRHFSAEDKAMLARLAGVVIEEIEAHAREMADPSARKVRWQSPHSDQRLKLLLHQLPGALWTTDAQLRITLSEGGALRDLLRDLAMRRGEAIGRSLSDFIGGANPADPNMVAHVDALAGKTVEYATVWSERHWDVRVEPLRDAEGAIVGTLGLALEVTDRAQLEQRLRESERLATLGMLAATVAHEIANPLSCVIANIDALEKDMEGRPHTAPRRSTEDVRTMLADAAEGGRRIAQIISDIRRFVAMRIEKDMPVDVGDAVRASLRMAAPAMRAVKFQLELGDTAPVLATEPRLVQVFVNLLVNAAHGAADASGGGAEVRLVTRMSGSDVIVEIFDNGAGIAPEHRVRLFEPFFTTKPAGMGTGLGLTIAIGIVTALNGRIEVESTPPHGSTFRVVLPALES